MAILRRVVSGVLLTGVLVALIVGTFTPYLHVCREEVAQTGDAGSVNICGPVAIADPVLLVAVLIALLLLLPDLKSLKILGLVELESKLDTATASVEETKSKVEEVSRQLIALSAIAVASNTTNIYQYDRTALRSDLDSTTARTIIDEHLESAGVDRDLPSLQADDVVPPSEAEASLLLLSLVEDLNGIAELGAARRPYTSDPPAWASEALLNDADGARRVVQRWRTVFGDELASVRGVRNRLAHAKPLEPGDILAATAAAGRLWVYAYLGLVPVTGDVRIEDERVSRALSLDPEWLDKLRRDGPRPTDES